MGARGLCIAPVSPTTSLVHDGGAFAQTSLARCSLRSHLIMRLGEIELLDRHPIPSCVGASHSAQGQEKVRGEGDLRPVVDSHRVQLESPDLPCLRRR